MYFFYYVVIEDHYQKIMQIRTEIIVLACILLVIKF